jgi:hypothetical protein
MDGWMDDVLRIQTSESDRRVGFSLERETVGDSDVFFI